MEGGKVDRVDGGKARGEDGGSDEQDKVGGKENKSGSTLEERTRGAYMYLCYSKRTHG